MADRTNEYRTAEVERPSWAKPDLTAICANCKQRPGTEIWVGDGGTVGLVHGVWARWCKRCVLEAWLARAREMAAKIPEWERELAELTDGGTT